MKKGKAVGPTGIVSEMFIAEEDCSVEWLTSLCNLIVAQWRIPGGVVFCYRFSKGKEIQWNVDLQSDKVTGTYNESDRTCVRKKDQRES